MTLNAVSLRVRYRPVRIGFCIPTNSCPALREAIRLNTTLWGGRFNPIIPVGDRRYADSILRAFRPDILLPVRSTPAVTKFIDDYPHLRGAHDMATVFTRDRDTAYPNFLSAYHPIRRLYEEQMRRQDCNLHPALFEISRGNPLADAIKCVTGEYPTASETGLDYPSILAEQLHSVRHELGTNAPIPENIFTALHPLSITTDLLQEDFSSARFHRYGDAGVFVGSARSVSDLVAYWNVLACGYEVAFFDPNFAEACLPACRKLLDQIELQRRSLPETRRYPAIWLADPEMAAPSVLGIGLSVHHVSPGVPRSFSPTPTVWTFDEHATLGSGGEYGSNSLSLALPAKPWFTDVKPSNEHVAVSVRSYSSRTDAVVIPPDLPELNEFYSREWRPGLDPVRSEPEGSAILMSTWQKDLTIFALDPSKLVHEVFQSVGITASQSKSGTVVSRLIAQMGGLQGCRAFKIRGVRELIAKHNPTQTFGFPKAREILSRAWRNDYKYLYLGPRDVPDLTAESTFAYLLEHKVFRPGLNLQCKNCLLTAWFALDEAKVQAVCPFCGQEFNSASQLRDDGWQYRRTGLFGRDDNQEGGVVVALTLQQLDTAVHHMIAWTTGVDLTWTDRVSKKCESDLVMLVKSNKGPCLAIGECKSDGGMITADDVRNLKAVADRFNATSLPVYIVFAKTSSFTPEEIRRCRSANGRYGHRVIMLGERELEPYHIFDRVNVERGLDLHGVDLEDIARGTASIYSGS